MGAAIIRAMHTDPAPRWTELAGRLLREHLAARRPLALALLGGLGLAAARLRLTWLVKAWVEGPMTRPAPGALDALVAEAALVLAVAAACLFASRYQLARVKEMTARALRERALARPLTADLGSRGALRDGDVLSRIVSDVPALGGFLVQVLKRYVGDGVVIAGGTVLVFVLDWRLALLVAALLPAAALLLKGTSARLRVAGGA